MFLKWFPLVVLTLVAIPSQAKLKTEEVCSALLEAEPRQGHFQSLSQASVHLSGLRETYERLSITKWLPYIGQHFDPSEDLKTGFYYGHISHLDNHATSLRSRSYEKMILLNGANVVFGTFIPTSKHSNISKREFDNYPYLVWNENGSVDFKTTGLRAHLLAELREKAPVLRLFRSQTPLDESMIKLFSAIHFGLRAESQKWQVEVLKRLPKDQPRYQALSRNQSPLEFAALLFELRNSRVLFLTPDESWAEYRTIGSDKTVAAYDLSLKDLPQEIQDNISFSADNGGAAPSKLKVAMPFGTFEMALLSASVLSPASR